MNTHSGSYFFKNRWNRRRLDGSVKLLAVLAVAMFMGSCSETDGPSADIAIGITPSKVFIVPGTGSSCRAFATAKQNSEDTVERDLTGERAYFQNFTLQWRSPNALTISEIAIEMTGSVLKGEEGQKLALDEAEIQALTGLEDLTIERDDNRSARLPYNLESNSTQRKGPADPYAPCGLHISGISTKETQNTGSISIKITLRGYSTDSEGNQKPIRQTTTVRAEKL